MSLRPMSKMKNFNFFSLGELFVVKILGSGGSIMYHKTFGNMKHPNTILLLYLTKIDQIE